MVRDANLDKINTRTDNGIVNAANSRLFRLALYDGAGFTLIGTDGGLLPRAVNLSDFLLSNPERLDVLLDRRSVTAPVFLLHKESGWSLLQFRPRFDPASVAFADLPQTWSTVTPLGTPVTSRRTQA